MFVCTVDVLRDFMSITLTAERVRDEPKSSKPSHQINACTWDVWRTGGDCVSVSLSFVGVSHIKHNIYICFKHILFWVTWLGSYVHEAAADNRVRNKWLEHATCDGEQRTSVYPTCKSSLDFRCIKYARKTHKSGNIVKILLLWTQYSPSLSIHDLRYNVSTTRHIHLQMN